MAKTTTKAKKATPTPTPPATTPDKRTLKPHEAVLSPTIQGAVAIEAWGRYVGKVDLADLVTDLRERVEKVQGGDMQPVEAMLYAQAVTLETIFTSLARRATSQEYLKQFQAYLGLALKAQAQCRATLEALAEIKNPRPVLITKQANISGGHQQVNNGAAAESEAARARAHAAENSSPQNELLEQQHGIELDTRAQGATGGADRHLAAVGTVHGAAHA
jgi:hypothetical protein